LLRHFCQWLNRQLDRSARHAREAKKTPASTGVFIFEPQLFPGKHFVAMASYMRQFQQPAHSLEKRIKSNNMKSGGTRSKVA
jgi:hypothetical protein